MQADTVFAVVDIEATSGSIGTNERMIQFACVLYQNGKVLETFETLVNPVKKIPKRIQKLTGISQQDVENAPYFEEIAELIHSLLADTVFVAHNVNFDFRFINEQFKLAGMAPLDIPAVDTVNLAEILFPMASNYNLKDLIEWLGSDLDQAHNALYDAQATIYLLDRLIQKAASLPLITLDKLAKLSTDLPYNTGRFFKKILESQSKEPKDLDEDLIIVNQLAIKKPDPVDASYEKRAAYPETTAEKENFFAQNFKLRAGQGDLMDALYTYFEKDGSTKEMAIEAPSGVGKSIGYIFPAFMTKGKEKPTVISTYTTLLQEQLMEEAIPLIERNISMPVSAVIMKGKSHYLSLNLFDNEMSSVTAEDTEALYCMKILVWLTETTTGDMDELGIGKGSQHPFWERIRTIDQILPPEKRDETYEFYDRMLYQAKHADFVVTNHAFLNHDLKRDQRLIPDYDHLIIDEAHHYLQSLNQVSLYTIKNSTFRRLKKQFKGKDDENTVYTALNYFLGQNLLKNYQFKAIESNTDLLNEEWKEFIAMFSEYFSASSEIEVGWEEVRIENPSSNLKKASKRIKQIFEEILFYLQGILEKIEKHFSKLAISDVKNLDEIFHYTNEVKDFYKNFIKVFDFSDTNELKWLSFHTNSPEFTVQFKIMSVNEREAAIEGLHQTEKIVYISSTLSVNQSISFFQKQIGAADLEYLEFDSPYDYKNQAKLIVPNSLRPVKKMSNKNYIDEVVKQLELMLKRVNHKILVLFHSKELLQGIFTEILNRNRLKDFDLLAQDLTGSRSKVLRQFKKSDRAILFGADSYFEGIDLPGDLLEVVILTKLPFDSPEVPIVKAKHNQLIKDGENIFLEDLLPRAVLKTKQAFGRLIRSKSDRGIFIVLDDRFITANYAKVFQDSLPDDLEVEFRDLGEIPQVVESFLNDPAGE